MFSESASAEFSFFTPSAPPSTYTFKLTKQVDDLTGGDRLPFYLHASINYKKHCLRQRRNAQKLGRLQTSNRETALAFNGSSFLELGRDSVRDGIPYRVGRVESLVPVGIRRCPCTNWIALCCLLVVAEG